MHGQAEAAPAGAPRGETAQRVSLSPRHRARRRLAAAFARRGARTLARRTVLALLTLAALLRLTLILRGWPSLDSDEAVVGLMARHILHNGEFPDFFWGQFYLGPLQAYAAAAVFAIFGASLVALRLPALLLTLGMLAGVYGLGRAAYGRVVGLLALAWLALGPPYALIREIVADGGHQEMLLLAALVLLGVWDRLRQPAPNAHRGESSTRSESSLNPLRPLRFLSAFLHALRVLRVLREPPRTPRSPHPPARSTGTRVRTLLAYAGIGAAMGLGFWSDPLMLPVLIAGLGALLLGRRRELFSLAGIALIVGFCAGAFPFLLFNVTTGGASFAQIARQRQLPGGRGTSFSLATLLSQIGETLAVALPVSFGSPHVCVTQGNIWSWYPPRLAANVGGTGLCQDANMLFSLAILTLYAAAALPIIRRVRVARNAEDAEDAEVRGGRAGGDDRSAEGAEDRRDRGEENGESAPERSIADAAAAVQADESAPRGLPPQRPPARAREQQPDSYPLSSSSDSAPVSPAALWLRGMLLFIALFTIAAYASGTDAQLNQFTAARYFISLSLTVPLLFGVLWSWAQPAARAASAWATERIARQGGGHTSQTAARTARNAASSAVPSAVNRTSSPRPPRASASSVTPSSVISALVLVVVFALAICEAGYTLRYAGSAGRFGLPMTRTDRQLIAFLDARHITRYYGDYWTCYQIAFESDERIRCAVRGQNGEPQLKLLNNRYPGYERLLASTPNPAYIVPAGSAEDAGFVSEAAAQGLPHDGYVRAVVAGYAVYYHPG